MGFCIRPTELSLQIILKSSLDVMNFGAMHLQFVGNGKQVLFCWTNVKKRTVLPLDFKKEDVPGLTESHFLFI